MKILKYAMPLIAVGIIAGCSTTDNASDTGQSSQAEYETKKLSVEDVEKIKYGDTEETVYETLGKPLKEWSSEFVYEELEGAISRDEITAYLVEESEDAEQLIQDGNNAMEIDNLKMLQYTYEYDGEDETSLIWISPRTDTVVHTNRRSFIDENGNLADETLGTESDESIESSGDEEFSVPIMSYSIGDTVSFESNEGDEMDVTVNSVSKFAGDDWDVPEGSFFAKVDFTISNIGTIPLDVNSLLFEFYDAEGFKSSSISKDYFSETIQPGKSAKGVVYFDVMSEGSTFEVYFADTVWTGEYQ